MSHALVVVVKSTRNAVVRWQMNDKGKAKFST